VSAWLARGGARPVGVDVTPAQLETARRCMAETGIEFPLVEADAAETGLPDASADLVVSEYGASIWCDPPKWILEAARLLRTEGELVFLRGSTLQMLCSPDTGPVVERLARPQRGLYKLEWYDDDPGVEFHPPTAEMHRILRESGFELLDFRELYAPEDAVDHEYYDTVPAEWAKRWPDEEIWRLRLHRR
jgi:SAM-dependent methyltransferase